ncbi:hypothetical protein [Spongiivirga citrea]|uniref:Peptidase M50 domain-containing protein n=1 Tax=Spongiivirga citrea TaxID=1481457 RepID=A0A6M0CK84_9FLAO|nr:hypothetical protein [Spongiivirga citrea]NER18251.1 hypothetical protein [Spongiivirga citrea]
MLDKRTTARYFIVAVVVVMATWIIHEFAHWLTSRFFGYDAIMTLNGTFYESYEKPTIEHSTIVSAAGPLITILQGAIIFVFLKLKSWNKYLFLGLFVAFYMRFLAGIINIIKLNDEARISEYLEIGTFTLPIVVSGLLFSMVFVISKKYQLSRKFLGITTLIVMFLSSVLILMDQFFHFRLL